MRTSSGPAGCWQTIRYHGDSYTAEVSASIFGKAVTAIGEGAFEGCVDLGSVILPDSVTAIDAGAFADCQNLRIVNLPKQLTTIGMHRDGTLFRRERI